MTAITNQSTITTVSCNDTDALVLTENLSRREVYITAVGGDVWVKLTPTSDNERKGMLIRSTAPFPFGLMPDMIYYGVVYAINAVDGEAPILHVTELNRE